LPLPNAVIFLDLSLPNIKLLLQKKAEQERGYLGKKGLDEAEKNLTHQKYAKQI